MLLKPILALLVPAVATSALPMPSNCNFRSNATSRSARSLLRLTPLCRPFDGYIPNTIGQPGVSGKENTYTTQQIERFQEAHEDVLMMCRTVIKEAMENADHLNKILDEYFGVSKPSSLPNMPSGREQVIDVFKSIFGDKEGKGNGKGNPKFANVDIVDNFPHPDDEKGRTECFTPHEHGAVMLKAGDFPESPERSRIIICPFAFTQGSFSGKELPGVGTRTCEDIGDTLTDKNGVTLGSVLLHEYTRNLELVEPALEQPAEDRAYGFRDTQTEGPTRKRKLQALRNADSFHLFALELTWSKKCGKDFNFPRIDPNTLSYTKKEAEDKQDWVDSDEELELAAQLDQMRIEAEEKSKGDVEAEEKDKPRAKTDWMDQE